MELRHPLGSRAKILLTSVFGPYAHDDEYGSRKINPMELYHNQVTREQGPFSLRMFHRSFGLMLIKENLDAPCTLLDFPSLDDFTHELKAHAYDIVGISAILPNVGKVKKMCGLIRLHQPGATIIIGGHIANKPDLSDIIDADHICKGEGIRWMRKYLGLDENAPIKHPYIYSGFGTRILGISAPEKSGDTAAMLIPSVGCPVGCNFCSTSALYGGKGKHINFYESGDELFKIMCDIETNLKVNSFFVMDENFLLHRTRALRLLELMIKEQKSWSLYVFSSARVLRSYTMEQLIRLGVSWVWMGLEGEDSSYAKLSGVETKQLVRELQSHGIRVLGSTIIGLEKHTPENMDAVIDYAVSHDTVFHQFMLYTPIPGTPLYAELEKDGTILNDDEFPAADTHGQYRFNYRHPAIQTGNETEYLRKAFARDFEMNGPSLARMFRAVMTGWKRYKNHPDPCIRERFQREIKYLKSTYSAAVWAMKKWYRKDRMINRKIESLLQDIYQEFGWTRLVAPVLGIYVYLALKREQKRLKSGWTYEPRMFCEKNLQAVVQEALSPSASMNEQPAVPQMNRLSQSAQNY
jgi:radical SAM superfamily enzyme YgiQ (UPF0313 family)